MPSTATGMGQFSSIFTALGSGDLTTAYSGNQVALSTHGSESAALYIDYTKGSETSVQVQVEVWDPTNGWFVVPYSEGGTPELSMTATASKRWGVRRIARFEQQLRVSAKVTGSANGTTSLTATLQLGSSRFPIAGNVT